MLLDNEIVIRLDHFGLGNVDLGLCQIGICRAFKIRISSSAAALYRFEVLCSSTSTRFRNASVVGVEAEAFFFSSSAKRTFRSDPVNGSFPSFWAISMRRFNAVVFASAAVMTTTAGTTWLWADTTALRSLQRCQP